MKGGGGRSATPPRGAPARGPAPNPPARSVPTRTAPPAAGGGAAGGKPPAQRGAPAAGGRSSFQQCCPNQELPAKHTGVGVCILLYAVFCFVAAFTSGWYKVRYSPDMTVPTCSMPLSECTLAACKPGVKRTGYVGEGDCSTQQYAQLLFILAAIYALCYLMFISGVLVPGSVSKWTSMNFQECCTRSSECRPLGDKQIAIGPMQCCPCAHGVMICGTPLLMLLGLLTVVVQDRTEFELMPDQGYGPVFWISLVLALCMLVVAVSTSKAERALQAGARRALPPRPPPRAASGGANRLMPASAPHGFNYYTPPSQQATTVQNAAQLATANITANSQVNRIQVDGKNWVALPADFRPLLRGA